MRIYKRGIVSSAFYVRVRINFRMKKMKLLGSPSSLESHCLPLPESPAEILKIMNHDSKYIGNQATEEKGPKVYSHHYIKPDYTVVTSTVKVALVD